MMPTSREAPQNEQAPPLIIDVYPLNRTAIDVTVAPVGGPETVSVAG